jgi:maltose/moltooligosaccharide transporter
VVASALPWMFTNWFGVGNVAEEGVIPDSVKWSFYVGGVAFLTAVMWTVFSTKEYPPSEEELKNKNHWEPLVIRYTPKQYFDRGLVLLFIGTLFGIWFYVRNLEPQLYVLCGIFGLFGFSYVIASLFMYRNRYHNGFVQMVRDFQNMPSTMVQLAFVQFFSWFALFAMWIYTTSAVTSHIYHSTDPTTKAYNDGADWVSILFAGYNGIAALVAFALPVVAKYTSRKATHMLALTCGGGGLISFYFISNPVLLIISMIGVGIAWASILSVPYAMLSASIPAKKMGYYMGIFNFFIVIPQIVAASILGYLVTTFFHGQFVFALIIGGLSMIVAGLLCLRVQDHEVVSIKEGQV